MVALFAGLLQLGNSVVNTLDVGRVVLTVVQLVDLSRDVGLQRSVVIVQIGQCVLSHEIPFRLRRNRSYLRYRQIYPTEDTAKPLRTGVPAYRFNPALLRNAPQGRRHPRFGYRMCAKWPECRPAVRPG
ncbi:Uncharacterised protein [Mycobacteroides abscessus subsp. abscessus]|nr:Uncharacterised protein [Mycobacteroides abscessus subsp. abscessus]